VASIGLTSTTEANLSFNILSNLITLRCTGQPLTKIMTKIILSIVAVAFTLLYVFCAFVSWDLGVLAHTTEGCRIGFVLSGLFLSSIGTIIYSETQES
jgi:hypothetical protein